MKFELKQIPVYLLAMAFIVFGLNHFIGFLPQPKPEGLAAEFFGVFAMKSKYMDVIKVLEIVGGLMLLIPRTRAMGICLIAPIVVNILLFEILIAGQVSIGALLTLLTVLAIYFNKQSFNSIFKETVSSK